MESVYSPPANVALSTPARRRARTTRRQFQILERFFSEQTAYPDKKQKQQLAQLVGFTEESVHFWFQNHRQSMRTAQGRRRQQQQQDEPSSSIEHDTSMTTATTTTTITTTLASTATIDPVPEQRTQIPPPVSSSSYPSVFEPSSSSSHMAVHSSQQQAFSYSNQTYASLQGPTHAARLPPFSSFVHDQTHTASSPVPSSSVPPRTTSSTGSYFSAFTPTSINQQQQYPATTSAAPSGAGRVLPAPGTARLPPIHFYFHHPEFGMESTMLQLSTFGKADQSSG